MSRVPIPLQIGGLVAWYDADDDSTITDSAGAVSQWDDKSPNQFNLAQATADEKPRTGTNTMGGKNVIDSDGGDFMSNASVPYTTVGTIITVHKNTSLTATKTLVTLRVDASNSVTQSVDGSSDLFGSHEGGGTEVGVTKADYAVDTDYIIFLDWSEGGDSSNLYVNGVDEGEATTLGTFAGSPTLFVLGAAAGSSITADIAEILYYDHVFSTAERDKIRNYLANKWGISA